MFITRRPCPGAPSIRVGGGTLISPRLRGASLAPMRCVAPVRLGFLVGAGSDDPSVGRGLDFVLADLDLQFAQCCAEGALGVQAVGFG